MSFFQLAFLSLFSLVSIFCARRLLQVSENPLLPQGPKSQLEFLSRTLLLCNPGVCSNSCPLNRWYHPTISSFVILFSSCPQSFPASVFSNELALCVRWPKYWSFSFSISSSNEYSVLISFRIYWFDLLAVQGTLKESSPAPQFINGCYYKKTRNQELYSFHW